MIEQTETQRSAKDRRRVGRMAGMFLGGLSVLLAGTPGHADNNLFENSGFESGVPGSDWPAEAGVTSGDTSAYVAAMHDVVPLDGNRMLMFLHTTSSGPSQGLRSQVIQLIDLKSVSGIIDDDRGHVRLTVSFNRQAGDAQTDTRFVPRVLAYAGAISEFPTLWSQGAHEASAQAMLLSDADPSTWEATSVTLDLPFGTDFVAIELAADENIWNDSSSLELDGHFCDDVRVEFHDILTFDLDNSGLIDLDDAFALVESWGDCDGCPADLNGDGGVDPGDLGILFGYLGITDCVTDSDGDMVPDCVDGCPTDTNKTSPGACGCGEPDVPGCGGDDRQLGWWINLGPQYVLESGLDLTLELAPDAPPIGDIVFQVWSDVTQSIEVPTADDSAPFVYPADLLSQVTPGTGEIQALIRGPDLEILDTVIGTVEFVVMQPCITDLNGDGLVDVLDFLEFIAGWQLGSLDYDLDYNGVVDYLDLLTLLSTWGLCDCGPGSVDSDHDGTPDCQDECPLDPNKVVPGFCGCGIPDVDTDADGLVDCEDPCVFDPCGCQECEGWTTLEPSADSRIIYVSASTGNDSTGQFYDPADGAIGDDPFHPDGSVSAFRTLAAAIANVRQGAPDWILLRRGDVWTNEVLGHWTKSGRSADEPVVIGAYGPASARPLLRTGTSNCLYTQGGGGSPPSVDYLAIVGLHMHAHTYTGIGEPVGIRHLRGGTSWLIEDCMIEGYATNVVLQAFDGPVTHVTMRRSVIIDAFSTDGHAQGIYAGGATDLIIEQCIFDHNGWNPSIPGAEKTIYNHNLYIGIPSRDVTIRDCIVARGSSHGVQLRPAGTCNGNLCLENGMAIQLGTGGSEGGGADPPWPLSGEAIGNVILDGTRIGSAGGGGKGIALIWCNDGAIVADNIIAHQIDGLDRAAIHLSDQGPVGNHDIIVRDNVIYDWGAPVRLEGVAPTEFSGIALLDNECQEIGSTMFLVHHDDNHISQFTSGGNRFYRGTGDSQSFKIAGDLYDFAGWAAIVGDSTSTMGPIAYPNPNRSVGSYHATLGGVPTTAAFMDEARKQSRMNWRPGYTAAEAVEYFRAGFGR